MRATSEGIPSSIDIEFLELNINPYVIPGRLKLCFIQLNACFEDGFGWICGVFLLLYN